MAKTLDEHVDALTMHGYTVVEGALSVAELDGARRALDSIFRREAVVGPLRGWHNEICRVTYMLPQKHPLFRAMFQKEQLLSLMHAALGPRCILSSMNGYTTTPGGAAQALHIDQDETVPGTILTINALHTLDDFTRENGCTRLVPGSQNRCWTGAAADVESAEIEAVHVEAPAGSVIAYAGAIWHASGRNDTTQERRALHAFFAREWVRPQWDFPGSLSEDVAASLTPEERTLLGFSTPPTRYDPGWDQDPRVEPRSTSGHSMLRALHGWRPWSKRRVSS